MIGLLMHLKKDEASVNLLQRIHTLGGIKRKNIVLLPFDLWVDLTERHNLNILLAMWE